MSGELILTTDTNPHPTKLSKRTRERGKQGVAECREQLNPPPAIVPLKEAS